MEKHNVSRMADTFDLPVGVVRLDSAPLRHVATSQSRGRIRGGVDAFGFDPSISANAVAVSAPANLRISGV